MSTHDLGTETERHIRRFVVLTPDQTAVIALWVLHSHAIDAFDLTPYLLVTSPDKRCGKSRLREVLSQLVPNPWTVLRPTESVLFRKISSGKQTLLFDEIDTVFSSRSDPSQEGIRAILNGGFERGATVPRAMEKGEKLTEFEVFCPKALFGIGLPPDTVCDRSFLIEMRRKTRRESCERFRRRDAAQDSARLRKRLEEWTTGRIEGLRNARPSLPEALNDRAQDAAEPLLAIADELSGDWPERARRALVSLAGESDTESDSLCFQLLSDLRVIDDRLGRPATARTQTLLDELRSIDHRWSRFSRGDAIEANDMARLVKGYRLRSKTIRFGSGTARGYDMAEMRDVFDRYLPSFSEQTELDETATPPALEQSEGVSAVPTQRAELATKRVTDRFTLLTANTLRASVDCDGVSGVSPSACIKCEGPTSSRDLYCQACWANRIATGTEAPATRS